MIMWSFRSLDHLEEEVFYGFIQPTNGEILISTSKNPTHDLIGEIK